MVAAQQNPVDMDDVQQALVTWLNKSVIQDCSTRWTHALYQSSEGSKTESGLRGRHNMAETISWNYVASAGRPSFRDRET